MCCMCNIIYLALFGLLYDLLSCCWFMLLWNINTHVWVLRATHHLCLVVSVILYESLSNHFPVVFASWGSQHGLCHTQGRWPCLHFFTGGIIGSSWKLEFSVCDNCSSGPPASLLKEITCTSALRFTKVRCLIAAFANMHIISWCLGIAHLLFVSLAVWLLCCWKTCLCLFAGC